MLPNGGSKLVTLRDAANYIVKLPKAEQQAAEWQAAAEVLMLIGEQSCTATPKAASRMNASSIPVR
jgi:hypothetical protein